MSTRATTPEHTPSSRRDSISEESVDVRSTETDDAYPQPPMAPYPSPYRGVTAAAFTDINRALAVRSLRDSVRVSSGNLPANKGAARPVPNLRSPSSFPGPLSPSPKAAATEPQTTNPASRPKQPGRTRSLTMPLRAWGPLRFKRVAVDPPDSQANRVAVALQSEGRKSGSSDAPSLGGTRLEKETQTAHSSALPAGSKPARKRRSTVACIIM